MGDAVDFRVRAPGFQLGVVQCLFHGPHGGNAGVGGVEDLSPVRQRVLCDGIGDELVDFVELPRVEAALLGPFGQPQVFAQLFEELRFQRCNRKVFAVGGSVVGVRGLRSVEEVSAASVLPHARVFQGPQHGGQCCRAVDDSGIDYLAPAGGAALKQGGEDAGDQEHGPTPEVANKVQRRDGSAVSAADERSHAGARNVAHVVTCTVCQRAVLPPAGHTAVHQAGIAFEKHIRPQAEALHDTGAEALNEHIGPIEQFEHAFDGRRVFQISFDNPAAARRDIRFLGVARPVDSHNISAEVSQDHRGVWTRAQSCELNDLQSGQRSCCAGFRVAVCCAVLCHGVPSATALSSGSHIRQGH